MWRRDPDCFRHISLEEGRELISYFYQFTVNGIIAVIVVLVVLSVDSCMQVPPISLPPL